jgi:serine/threonine protein kinase/Flp pilus assembly protein TadD
MQLTEDIQLGTQAPSTGKPRASRPTPDDPRVVRALEEYSAALKAGHRPDRHEFLASYPDVAEALDECLEGLDFVQAAAPLLQPPAGDNLAAASAAAAELSPEGPLGDYRLVREVGRGGMGIVYEAVQVSLGRRVALKVLPFASALDAKHLQRFKNEAQAAAHLHHKSIVPVHGVGCHRGVHYYAMQFIEGQTLAALIGDLRRLARQRKTDDAGSAGNAGSLAAELASGRWAPAKRSPPDPTGPYTPPEVGPQAAITDTAVLAAAPVSTEHSIRNPAFFRTMTNLGIQAAEALDHAHAEGVVHRDIKPGNLMVDAKGNLWITDFGLAHSQSEVGLTMTGDLVGTLRYMSPEQALAQRVVIDHRTDVYSLGATLYELLTLEPVFDGRDRQELLRQIAFEEPKPPRRLNKSIPEELETIVLKAMEKNPADRYGTAQELADDLRRFLMDESILARRPSPLQRARKWARRHPGVVRTTLVALAFLLVTIAVGASLAAWRLNEEQNATRDQLRLTEEAQQLAENRARQIRQDLEGLKAATGMLERGQVYADRHQWAAADAALTKAIQLRPEHSSLWTARGDLYTRLGLWEVAASDIAKAFELQEPDEMRRWHGHALLRLYVGDRNGYRQACVRMHDRFHGAGDPDLAMVLVRTCLLVLDPDTDPAALVELAQTAGAFSRHAWYLYALGIAHYRAGQYERGVERLRESLKVGFNWPAKGINYPVLAMAYHKLGREAEARPALDDAARAIDRWTQDRYQSASGNWVEHQGATGFWPIFWGDGVECQLYYREARALMGLPPPPDDPRLHVLRGRAFAGLRWPDKAVAEYAAALKLSPHDPQIRLEAHRNRGYYHVGLRQWDQAAAEFARASELQPDDAYLWHFRAVAHLAAGDGDAYRRVCAGMMERFSKTQDPGVAYQVVDTCVLRQDALPDLDQLLPVARVATRWYLGSIKVLAAAHYRAGHYKKAVEHFQQAAKVSRFRAWDWIFLAMAQHRLGRAEEAKPCLAKAIAWIDEANRQELDDLGGTRPAWGDWHEPIVVPLLRRETEALVNESLANHQSGR